MEPTSVPFPRPSTPPRLPSGPHPGLTEALFSDASGLYYIGPLSAGPPTSNHPGGALSLRAIKLGPPHDY